LSIIDFPFCFKILQNLKIEGKIYSEQQRNNCKILTFVENWAIVFIKQEHKRKGTCWGIDGCPNTIDIMEIRCTFVLLSAYIFMFNKIILLFHLSFPLLSLFLSILMQYFVNSNLHATSKACQLFFRIYFDFFINAVL
jgi:hypothetical protein